MINQEILARVQGSDIAPEHHDAVAEYLSALAGEARTLAAQAIIDKALVTAYDYGQEDTIGRVLSAAFSESSLDLSRTNYGYFTSSDGERRSRIRSRSHVEDYVSTGLKGVVDDSFGIVPPFTYGTPLAGTPTDADDDLPTTIY
jgi:hypothetical protein